ncbi:MAG: MFS transporter, partial [Alphaproteobacteria bacterium]|nr:MFS transporter [Alphaproteobacteria bacterium]
MTTAPGMRPALGVTVVGLGTAIGSLDTAVNIAFPDIVRSLGIELGDIQWVVICYVLTYASLMLVCGRLGDLFGHARLFRIGLAWSVAAFIACALAPAFEILLAARVAQGVGTAMVLAVGPALATAYFPESSRARVLGAYTLLFALGGAVGPSLGGLLVDAMGWAGVFWFRAPIALAALLLFRAPPVAAAGGGAPRFDAVGAALLVLALGCLLLGINRAASGGWFGAALLLAALAAGAWFALRSHPSPIIRLAPFRRPGFSIPAASNIAVNLVGFAVMLLVPFWLDRVAGLDVLTAGALLALSPLGMALASPFAGRWVQRRDGRLIAAAGALAVA